MKQQTVQSSVSLSGIGLHTGTPSTITIQAAKAGSGITFKRIDLDKPVTISATADYVHSTQRSTKLKKGDATIQTVEHLLAAFVGLGIDNALVEVDGVEIPIMDGSSQPFVDAIESVGIVELDADRAVFEIKETITVRDEATGSEIIIMPSDKYELTVMVDFASPFVKEQFATLSNIENFKTAIAPCRTFAFLDEVEMLLNQGLIKGGSLDNAVVFANRKMSADELKALAPKIERETVALTQHGNLNTTELHFPNEAARHKLLDVVGDLALAGVAIKGRVIARKPGHSINTKVAALIRKKYQKFRKIGEIPHYDPRKTPVKDTVQIEAMLPHRHPFLLVDKIIEMSEKHVVGVKNVTYDEYFFRGHFPNNPIMPGVLQIEAMAQTGGILALSTVPDPENWDTYFLRIDNAKFKQKVVPGDTLIFKMVLTKPIRRGMVVMHGTAYVGDNLVSEGDLVAQIIRRDNV